MATGIAAVLMIGAGCGSGQEPPARTSAQSDPLSECVQSWNQTASASAKQNLQVFAQGTGGVHVELWEGPQVETGEVGVEGQVGGGPWVLAPGDCYITVPDFAAGWIDRNGWPQVGIVGTRGETLPFAEAGERAAAQPNALISEDGSLKLVGG